MPLLAAFIGSIATALAAFFSRFVAFNLALKLAAYTAWITVATAFFLAVVSCVRALITGASAMFSAAGAVLKFFGMGVGMFVPSNSGSVLGCLAAVWIGCQVYKIQKQGMHHYSK